MGPQVSCVMCSDLPLFHQPPGELRLDCCQFGGPQPSDRQGPRAGGRYLVGDKVLFFLEEPGTREVEILLPDPGLGICQA